MKTLIEVLTKGDEMTLPGGIAIRKRESSDEWIVHYFSTDRETGKARDYFQGSYCLTLSEAFGEFARRVERAERYDAGGALDIEAMGFGATQVVPA